MDRTQNTESLNHNHGRHSKQFSDGVERSQIENLDQTVQVLVKYEERELNPMHKNYGKHSKPYSTERKKSA